MNRKTINPFSSLKMNKKGMTLLPLILMIIIMGGLIVAGITLVAPLAKRAKVNDTRNALDAAIKAVISWSIVNNRIPDTSTGSTGFVSVVGNPNDAWGKQFIYIAADNLLNPSPVGICNRGTTNLKVSPVTDNIAFVVLSGGDDYTVNSIPNTSQAYNGTVTVSQNDIVRWVTLEELKNKTGCYSTTQGRLKILNNELPKASCTDSSYTATVYADGGIPFTSGEKYKWCIQTTSGLLPPGITADSSNVVNTDCQGLAEGSGSWVQADTRPLGGVPTTSGFITFFVRDNNDTTRDTLPLPNDNDNIAQKTLRINVACTPIGSQVSFANNIGDFPAPRENNANAVDVNLTSKTIVLGGDAYNTYGCIWSPLCSTAFPGYPPPPCSGDNYILRNKTMRAYFDFVFKDIDSGLSTNYRDGFTFALIQGSNATNVCGGTGGNLGYAGGTAPTIAGRTVAIEFDTYRNTNDPIDASNPRNHIAVDKDRSINHNAGTNPRCNGIDPGCYYTGSAPWLEDRNNHNARIEIGTMYSDATCTTLSPTGNYAKLKAWVDCIKCYDLTSNYTTATPQVTHCFQLYTPAMDAIKFGFTEGTSARSQTITISNFGIGFY
jgi:type II secretory pathway pseudopilin PulG